MALNCWDSNFHHPQSLSMVMEGWIPTSALPSPWMSHFCLLVMDSFKKFAKGRAGAPFCCYCKDWEQVGGHKSLINHILCMQRTTGSIADWKCGRLMLFNLQDWVRWTNGLTQHTSDVWASVFMELICNRTKLLHPDDRRAIDFLRITQNKHFYQGLLLSSQQHYSQEILVNSKSRKSFSKAPGSTTLLSKQLYINLCNILNKCRVYIKVTLAVIKCLCLTFQKRCHKVICSSLELNRFF